MSHPLLSFYVLASAISPGAILIAAGLSPGGFPATPQQLQAAIPYAVPAMLGGPGIAGLLLTGVLDGRAGFHELRTRLLTWRGGRPLVRRCTPHSAAVDDGSAPCAVAHLPDVPSADLTSSGTTSVLLMGLAVGLPTGILEELGWTAFAIPRLRLRHGVLVTGLIVASGRMGACQWRCSCMQALQLPQIFSSLRPLDQWFRLCCRDVAGRCGGRHCPRRHFSRQPLRAGYDND